MNFLSKTQGLFINMHRIVAEAFIHNDMPKKKTLVDHINGDKLDYDSNLFHVKHKNFKINKDDIRHIDVINVK